MRRIRITINPYMKAMCLRILCSSKRIIADSYAALPFCYQSRSGNELGISFVSFVAMSESKENNEKQ